MWARWAGRIHRHSTSENDSARVTTTGSGVAVLAISPGRKNICPTNIMVEITANITGLTTARVPITAPLAPVSPAAWWACTDSPTIIASSTTIPRINRNAISEIMFRLMPVNGSTKNVPMNAMAMPTHTHMANSGRRNTISSRNTSTSPPTPFFTSMLVRSRNGSAASRQNSSDTPSGRVARVRSTQRCTDSLVARVSGLEVT